MRQRVASVARLTAPFRSLLNRFAMFLLVLSALAIMFLEKVEMEAIDRVRAGVIDTVAPVLEGFSRPIATASSGAQRLEDFLSVYDENQRLREQNSRLLKWQNKALALTAENSTLRQMLNFVPEKGTETAAARVIGDSGGVFAQSVLINAGMAVAVERGDAVVSDLGLVGRVAEAGRKSARVLLVTDFNSRIPVVSEKNRVRGILFGDNSSAPRLAFLPTDNGLELGDRIVTSGHGHVFPAGIPVGTISSIEEGDIRVVPFVNFDRLEYVRIITHFPGEINGRIVPSTVRTLQVK